MPHNTNRNPGPSSNYWIEPRVDYPANIVILSTAPVTEGHRILCQDLLTAASVDGRPVMGFRLASDEASWVEGLDSIVNVEITELPISSMSSTDAEEQLHRRVKQFLDVPDFSSPVVFIDHVHVLDELFGEEDCKRVLDRITELVNRNGYIAYYRYQCGTLVGGVPEHLSGFFDYSASPLLNMTGWQLDPLE